ASLLVLTACPASRPEPAADDAKAKRAETGKANTSAEKNAPDGKDEAREQAEDAKPEAPAEDAWRAQEKRLSNLKQRTNGGEYAEAYLSFDEQRLVFQSTRDGAECDQIYTMRIDGSELQRVSSGKGRTTCA